jgi:heme/copper-type cytochrome/quinol oxidase subunit 2
MTRKETTAVSLKCFAIYILSQIIIGLPAMVTLTIRLKDIGATQLSQAVVPIILTLSVLVGIAAAVLVWKTTNSLMTKETSPDETGGLSVNDVMKLVLACMGVYFIIDAIMVLPHAIVSYQMAKMSPNPVTTAYLVAQVLEVIFGGLLIAMPGKWVKAIRSIGKI